MGHTWLAVTNLPAQRQSTRTQLYKNQVWVFGCQISQLLQKETQKSARGKGNAKHHAGVPAMAYPGGKHLPDVTQCL